MARTVINLRDDLVSRAQRLTGLRKKVDVVNLALAELVRRRDIRKILDLSGRVEGDWPIRIWRRERAA